MPTMLRAVIFDCDGVLADTEPLHCRALAEVLRDHDVAMPLELYERDYLGMTDPDMFRKALAENGRPNAEAMVARLVERKAGIYPRMQAELLQPIPGAVELVRRCAAQWPLAICSGAFRADIESIVQRFGIADQFQTIVSNEDVPRGKPHPDGFLAALERLNSACESTDPIRPDQCAVIEDSLPGVAAARAAGMRVVRLSGDDASAAVAPDALVSQLDQIDEAFLRALCA